MPKPMKKPALSTDDRLVAVVWCQREQRKVGRRRCGLPALGFHSRSGLSRSPRASVVRG